MALRPTIAWTFATFTTACCARAAAAETAPTATASPLSSMVQGIFALAVVVGLIFAASWLSKKVGPRARSSGIVQVLGGASVGPREKVVVVRFGAQTLLLGVAPGHVALLHAADPGTIGEPPADGAPSFGERLRAARTSA